MILGEGEPSRTVDKVEDLISKEEPEKFEYDVKDENKGEFHLSLLFVDYISLKKSEHIKEWEYRMTSFFDFTGNIQSFRVQF